MKHFFCISNEINVNNKHRKCEISLAGIEKENGGMLHLFLNVGAAPSSGGHILHHAKTLSLNLMKLLLMDYHEYYVYCRLCGLSDSLREDSTAKTCANWVL